MPAALIKAACLGSNSEQLLVHHIPAPSVKHAHIPSIPCWFHPLSCMLILFPPSSPHWFPILLNSPLPHAGSVPPLFPILVSQPPFSRLVLFPPFSPYWFHNPHSSSCCFYTPPLPHVVLISPLFPMPFQPPPCSPCRSNLPPFPRHAHSCRPQSYPIPALQSPS